MILLDLVRKFLSRNKSTNLKSISDYKEDFLVNLGREQFKYLLKKKLSIPVALL